MNKTAQWERQIKIVCLRQIAMEMLRDNFAPMLLPYGPEHWSIAVHQAAAKLRSNLYGQKITANMIDIVRFKKD